MKEIKFRAWNPTYKTMHYPNGLVDNVFIQIQLPDKECGEQSQSASRRDMKPVLLMQYTGLKDKNGKEIYEGDIIIEHPESKYGRREVKFSFMHGFHDGGSDDYEIIGNIHEHPELLKP